MQSAPCSRSDYSAASESAHSRRAWRKPPQTSSAVSKESSHEFWGGFFPDLTGSAVYPCMFNSINKSCFIYVRNVAALMRAIQTYQARRERRSNWKHLCRGGPRVHPALSPAKLHTLTEFPEKKTRLRREETPLQMLCSRECVCVCVCQTRDTTHHTLLRMWYLELSLAVGAAAHTAAFKRSGKHGNCP